MSQSKEAEPKLQAQVDRGRHVEKIPDTANHSTVTALSAADRDANQSSPITSPMAEKEKAVYSAVSRKMELENKFNSALKANLEAMVKLMQEIDDASQSSDSRLKQLADDKFDWKRLMEISEDIFTDYSLKMQEFTKEFDELNKVPFIPSIDFL